MPHGYANFCITSFFDTPQQFPSSTQAVRKAMRDSMSRVKWIDLLNDAQKQTIAETLIVSTMINLDRYATGKHQGNRQLVRAAKQDTELMVRSISGMDLTRYHLTSQGFQPR